MLAVASNQKPLIITKCRSIFNPVKCVHNAMKAELNCLPKCSFGNHHQDFGFLLDSKGILKEPKKKKLHSLGIPQTE